MTEGEELPPVDLESWNHGLCVDELGLFPVQVGAIIACMVAEVTGQLATSEWIEQQVGSGRSGLSRLARAYWIECYGRLDQQRKLWRATDRAWRSFGFKRPEKEPDAVPDQTGGRGTIRPIARGFIDGEKPRALARLRSDASRSRPVRTARRVAGA